MPKKEIVLALLGLTLIGAGVFWWKSGGVEEDKIEIIEASGEVASKVKVDIEGAVEKPGIYELDNGSRIGDVIEKAGLGAEADTKWIETYLNRAEVVKDGQKVYIPSVNDQASNLKTQTSSNNQVTSSKININNASQAELEELPGIGPVTAKKIIDGRPYGRIEELAEKKIVGQKVWEQIQGSVSVW